MFEGVTNDKVDFYVVGMRVGLGPLASVLAHAPRYLANFEYFACTASKLGRFSFYCLVKKYMVDSSESPSEWEKCSL
jgi:hypothetical protein